MTDFLVAVVLVGVSAVDALRWLRVAQREHYIAGSITRFSARWARLAIGLSPRGRTSKLVWTRRLRVLAAIAGVLYATLFVIGLGLGASLWSASLVCLLAVPYVVDLAQYAAAPIESQLLKPFIERASKKLKAIDPTIVGITGSYGKTSTKVVLAHLLSGTCSVSASPASFNNRAGLARAINEGLTPGTDVFIAEMGTYGPGEIADLCKWCPPAIAVMTAIGPVHLERFGDEETIVRAKSEIFATAHTVVLNVDDARLVAVADAIAGKKVVRVSATRRDVDVAIIDGDVFVAGELAGAVDKLPTAPTNAAAAVAVALELGVSPHDAVVRLAAAPGAAHRLEATTAPSGVVVLDDTFNSNPAGARRALDALKEAGVSTARRVLMTPGMIELGNRQAAENQAFARDAGAVADVIGVIGATNAKALLAGAAQTGAKVERFRTREAAVAWVRENLQAGDAVLYENDLPDHYR